MMRLSRRAFLGSPAASVLAAAPAKPNVLFMPVDDLNDWVEDFGGHPQTVTPNIHRLAQSGVRFQNAYCQAPMCNPSRASLLTGLRPSTTGVYENDDTWRDGAPEAVTLPEYFMKNGYRVEGCGKIFHSKQTDYGGFHAHLKDSDSDGYKGVKPSRGRVGPAKNFDWGPLDIPDERTPDFQVARYAAAFLSRQHRQPFFLACGFVKPHLPWYAPKAYFEKFAGMDVKLPPYLANDLDDVPKSAIREQALKAHAGIVGANQWQEAVAAYLACINYSDANAGRVLAALDASPYRDNTIVVLFGDHGWHLGEKDHWQKFTLWERSCRAPLIVRAPGMRTGADCQRVVELLDLYPTLVDLRGLPGKNGQEGRSLRPLLASPGAAWDRPAITSNGANRISVRTAGWRYTRYSDGEELYDERNDRNEWTNLASKPEHAATKARLLSLLPKDINRKKPRSWDSLGTPERQLLHRRPK